MKIIEIKPDQIWKDLDPRRAGRQVVITAVQNGRARCMDMETGHMTSIRIDNLVGANRKRFEYVMEKPDAKIQAVDIGQPVPPITLPKTSAAELFEGIPHSRPAVGVAPAPRHG